MKNLHDKIGVVTTIKLSSGEELVARIMEVDGMCVTLQEPLSIAPTPKGMQLVPSIFTGDESSEVTLNMNLVSMWTTTDESVRDKYIEAITGIQIPEKSIILG